MGKSCVGMRLISSQMGQVEDKDSLWKGSDIL